ncbi:WD40 repeat domain-containing protein [Vitreimonas sp.]|uniref:WD40 repeat domain-containing protein n=1 Tax=Vitreimonas sp. TaxID=3069702 RepID=UPI002D7A0B2F|nr:WD40 repeat domain-containing protein [Vitreimonas sp.]
MATAQSGSCALSEAAQSDGWRLEALAVIPGEHHTAYAEFSTISARRADWSYELWDAWTGEKLRQLTPVATYQTQNWIREEAPDRSRAVIDWNTGPASLVDMRTGETLATMPVFTGDHFECCVYFTEDSRWLVLSVPDGRYEIRNARTGALQGAFALPPDQNDLDLSADGQRMLVIDAHAIRLINTATGEVIAEIPRHASPLLSHTNSRFSPDGTRALVRNGWEWIYIDALTGATLAAGGAAGVDSGLHPNFPAFLNGARYAQFADGNGDRTIIDARTGRTHFALGALADEPWQAIHFGVQPSADGARLVARRADGTASLWDLRSGRLLAELGSFRAQSDFEAAPGEEEPILLHVRIGTSGEFTFTQNNRLITFDRQGQLSLWNARSGAMIRRLARNDAITAHDIEVSPDGHWIFAPATEEEVVVWNARTGARAITMPGFDAHDANSTWSGDGRYLAVEDGNRRELWDLRTRRRIADLGEPGGRLSVPQFSNDSAHLIFGRINDAGEESVALWSIVARREIADLGDFNYVDPMVIANRRIAEGLSSGGYALWTLDSGDRLLSCSDSYMKLVQRDGTAEVRLLEQTRENAVVIWRLAPPA